MEKKLRSTDFFLMSILYKWILYLYEKTLGDYLWVTNYLKNLKFYFVTSRGYRCPFIHVVTSSVQTKNHKKDCQRPNKGNQICSGNSGSFHPPRWGKEFICVISVGPAMSQLRFNTLILVFRIFLTWMMHFKHIETNYVRKIWLCNPHLMCSLGHRRRSAYVILD